PRLRCAAARARHSGRREAATRRGASLRQAREGRKGDDRRGRRGDRRREHGREEAGEEAGLPLRIGGRTVHRNHRCMLRRAASAACAALLVSSVVVACASHAQKPKTEDDDNSKAFAELEKNDKEDPVPMMADAGANAPATTPKGPVYPAPFTAE